MPQHNQQALDQIIRATNAKKTGDGWIGNCPAPSHDDRNPSFTFRIKDGWIQLKCQAREHAKQEYLDALGLKPSDLGPIDTDFNSGKKPKSNSAPKKKSNVFFADLAAAKKLPVDKIKDAFSVDDIVHKHYGNVVDIPYLDQKRNRICTRYRVELRGKNHTKTKKNNKAHVYGLQFLGGIKKKGFVIFVEGETDTWTVSLLGYPVLGIPGVNNTATIEREHIDGLDKIYAVNEGGAAGETFITGISAQLHKNGFTGAFFQIEFKTKHGVKDPSDLHIKYNGNGECKNAIQDALDNAKPIEIKPKHGGAALMTKSQCISELNKNFAVVSLGATVAILRERLCAETGRIETDFLKKADFELLHKNKICEVWHDYGAKEECAAKVWLEHPDRRQYEQVIFSPKKTDDKNYNLWRGFAFEPKQGDCSLYLSHIKDVICSGDDVLFRYVIAWMANAIQEPANKPGTAIVLRGKQGTGKGVFCRIFGSLFGQHYTQISQSRHLFGNFNAHLKDCLLCYADEAFWAGDKQAEGTLKAEITEPDRMIEMKGRDAILVRNYTRYLISSNNDWIVPAGMEERRFCVIDVSDSQMQNRDYFGAIEKQMDTAGRAALLYFLMNHDYADIDVGVIPDTAALAEQKILSMNPIEKFWLKRLHRGHVLDWSEDWEGFITKERLYEEFIRDEKIAGKTRRAYEMEFSTATKKLFLHIQESKRSVPLVGDDGRPITHSNGEEISQRKNGFILGDLSECRACFCRAAKHNFEWASEEEVSYLPF